MMSWVLFCSVGWVAYTYLGYPLLMGLWARLAPKPVRGCDGDLSVTIIVVAHNEAARISDKIDTCLNQDYPSRLLDILVVSDGSTDGMDDLVRAVSDPRVSLLAFDTRRGKAACLVDAVAACDADVLVFSDARQRLDSLAVRHLVHDLGDPDVGAVSGELVFMLDGATHTGRGIDAYWRYEKFIRRQESCVGSVVGVTGALYALRRECFEAIPPQTILDDVLIPMNVALQGRRVVFESRALAYDRPAVDPGQERLRKVRTLAGNFQLLSLRPLLLSPRRNPILFQFFSHKLTRLLAPLALLAMLVANLQLLGGGIGYTLLLVGQALLYGLPLFSHITGLARAWWLTRLTTTFVLMNAFVVLGFWEFLRNRDAHRWATVSPASSSQQPSAGA